MKSLTSKSIKLLKDLVTLFEENEKDLTDVPDEAVKLFGYSCLANSLMFKEPPIPKHETKSIEDYIKTHTFSTVDSLCSYIATIKDDLDKLYAIFCWAALNIEYDTESYFSHNIKGTSLEEVFKTKKAVCEGYALFFKEMAKRVSLDTERINVVSYSNYAKGYSFKPLEPPPTLKSNHASVYIKIDGVPFISEPTWGAGHLGSDKTFKCQFDSKYFLIPVYKTLNDHFPCEEAAKLIPFKLSYEDYLKSMKTHPLKHNIKTETNPFVKIDCKDGYLE